MASIGFGNTKEGLKEDLRGVRSEVRSEARELRGEAQELKQDAKSMAHDTKEALRAPIPVPAFSDMGKTANDMINKDFYHTAQATLDVKLKAPNGTNVNVKGKQGFDGVTAGSVEGKYTMKPQGVTVTQNWNTASLLDTKIELADLVAPGAKIDLQNLWNPSKGSSAAQKITAVYKKNNVHARLFANYAMSSGNIDAVADAVVGLDKVTIGGEAGYDLQKAAITRYSLGLGYQEKMFQAHIQAVQNLSVLTAGFYHRVNSEVEVGFKTGYDINGGKVTGLDLASKYKLDANSFAKAKINDRGIMALAYSTKLNPGTTLGLGLSLDTNKLNEAGHKVGTSLTFEG